MRLARGSGGLLRSDCGARVTPPVICAGVHTGSGEKAVLRPCAPLRGAIGAAFLPRFTLRPPISDLKPESLRGNSILTARTAFFIDPTNSKRGHNLRRHSRT